VDGCACEGVFFTDLVFQEAQVGEMGQFWIIAVKKEGRWVTPDLGAIINAKRSSAMGRWLVEFLGVLQDLIQLGG